METPVVEKRIETGFFKKHKKHMPAVVNIKKKRDANEEIARDLASKEI
jgi:hypothetical protein